jgi:hypothetical protein
MPDVFKRRYQVFVSSTYEDLIEERKHIIQALLETKCIPSGMEMFPASSEEKWVRIKRVIDDCDYFIIVVAGKYGSCGPNGKSFTEMEFDYAVDTGKPVLGFFHADLDSLPGAKLERTDEAREKLEFFTNKVKGGRVCHSRRMPHELASSVKTAIHDEIEMNPQTGWVRADAVVDSGVVAELKSEIEALRKSSASKQERFAGGEDVIEIPLNFTFFDDEKAPAEHRWSARKTLSYSHSTTWDQVFLAIGQHLVKKSSKSGVKRSFHLRWAKLLQPDIERRLGTQVYQLSTSVSADVFDRMLETFVALGLLRRVKPPTGVQSEELYWETTSRGIKRLAELKAVRSKQSDTLG